MKINTAGLVIIGIVTASTLSGTVMAENWEGKSRDGVVTLEGEVRSEAASLLAEEIASGYDHVSRVDNRLRVVASN